MLHVPLIILINVITTSTKDNICMEGITPNYGNILPRDPYVQIGDNISLTCKLDNETALNKIWNSNHIIWQVNNTELPPSQIKVLNRLKSSLILKNVNKDQSGYYYCIVKNHTICLSKVSVIDAFPEPENVTIVCPNFKTLNITWFLPKTNFYSSYKIKYIRHNPYVGTKSYGYENAKCIDGLNSGKRKCWSEFTNTTFMLEHQYQISIITMNKFGNKSWVYPEIFYPKTKVKLNPPKITNIYASKNNNIILEWTTDFLEKQVQCGYEVFYQSQWDSTWKNISSTINNRRQKVILQQVYPNSRYHVKIRIHFSASDYYSDFSESMLLTEKEAPLMSPNMTTGMFEIILLNSSDNQKILVHWKDIPFRYKGGDSLFYRVTLESDTENKTLTTNHSSVEIILPRKAYNVTIVAVNEIGSAKDMSCIHIPQKEKLLKNIDLDFFYFSYTKGLMNLTWHQIIYDPHLQVTIYRCENLYNNMCLDSLQWSTVSINATDWSFNIESNQYYQLGTSVDGNMTSSGIKWWSGCAVNFDQDSFGDIPYTYAKTSTSLQLNWNSTCRQRSFVRQYIFNYCHQLKPDENCQGKPQERTSGPQDTEIILKNLKPYSIYLITLNAVFINLIVKPISSKQVVTDISAPEDSPQNFIIVRHNETSITLSWSPPKIPNGEISEYIIILKNDTETQFSTNMTLLEIGNLRSDTEYSVKMRACTAKDNSKFCSKWSQSLTVTTTITVKYGLIVGIFLGSLACTVLVFICRCLILRARKQLKLPEVYLPIEIAGQAPLYDHEIPQEYTHQRKNLSKLSAFNLETIKEESDILKKHLDFSDGIQKKPLKCIRTEMYSNHVPTSIKMPSIPNIGTSESESLLLTEITPNSTHTQHVYNYKPSNYLVTSNFKLSNGDIKIKTSDQSYNGTLPNSLTDPQIDSYSQVVLGSNSYQSHDFFHNGLGESSNKYSRFSKDNDEIAQSSCEVNNTDNYSYSVKPDSIKKSSNGFKTMNLTQKPLNLDYLPQSTWNYLHKYLPENMTECSENGYSKFTIIDSGSRIKDVMLEQL